MNSLRFHDDFVASGGRRLPAALTFKSSHVRWGFGFLNHIFQNPWVLRGKNTWFQEAKTEHALRPSGLGAHWLYGDSATCRGWMGRNGSGAWAWLSANGPRTDMAWRKAPCWSQWILQSTKPFFFVRLRSAMDHQPPTMTLLHVACMEGLDSRIAQKVSMNCLEPELDLYLDHRPHMSRVF